MSVASQKITVKEIEIVVFKKDNTDYISLTDIAKYRGTSETDDVINNFNFKPVEFDGFWSKSGSNNFVLSPTKWIITTNAIGLVSKSGRNGGTFAHKDIAFEFATWLSPEFKLYLIKEFQRLKEDENLRLASGWNVKRTLTKINYKIHTNSIKENLIPANISKNKAKIIYASEADVLNVALFGITAKEWRDNNPKLEGNIRDYSDVTQLVVLANLEGINAELIRDCLSQSERLIKLNQIAIIQMKAILGNVNIKKLK